MASKPSSNPTDWQLKPGDKWHGFEGLAANHVRVDPIKVTILTPGLSADGTMQDFGIPAGIVTKFLSSRRIEIEKTGLYSFLVLFSMGITKGKWNTLVTELLNFKDLNDSNAPLSRALPALAEAHPEAYSKMGLKDLCQQIHQVYREDNLPRAQREIYTTLPEIAMRPVDADEKFVRGQVESIEIDNLMDRILAVMVVPYPPGIPLSCLASVSPRQPSRSRIICSMPATSIASFLGSKRTFTVYASTQAGTRGAISWTASLEGNNP